MKIVKIVFVFVALLGLQQCVLASSSASLDQTRQEVLKQYVLDLNNADYKDITQLFDKNGTVTSNSHGKTNAKDFFYSFLPLVEKGETHWHQGFTNDQDVNRFAVRFHFKYKLKNGSEGEGEYVDEFVFVDNSTKLLAVHMFENTKFEND